MGVGSREQPRFRQGLKVTDKKQYPTIPSRLRRVLKRELSSHIKGHMGADHFPHIKNVRSRTAKVEPEQKEDALPALVARLAVYSCSCGTLARTGLHEVERLGWILLMRFPPGLTSQIDVGEKNNDYVITRVSTGALALDLEKAVGRVRYSLRTRRSKDSELRVLKIPSMHVLAIWVHRQKSSERDYLIPPSHNFTGLKSGRTYTRVKAERLLKKGATEMILSWYERVQKKPEGADKDRTS